MRHASEKETMFRVLHSCSLACLLADWLGRSGCRGKAGQFKLSTLRARLCGTVHGGFPDADAPTGEDKRK